MKKQILLIHGRPAGSADPTTLKTHWLDAWQLGLKRGNLSVPEAEIRFAYYGDLFGDLPRAPELDMPFDAGPAKESSIDEFRLSVLEVIATRLNVINFQPRGVPAREKVQRLLQAFAEAEVSNVSLLLQLADDVYRYLADPAWRAQVIERILQHVDPERPAIVAGHAFGAVVAYDILDHAAAEGWNVPLLVTLAAPLGIPPIRDKFGAPRVPGTVSRWCNARDPQDLMPLFPLDSEHFPLLPPAAILNKSDVRNRTDNHHGIQGYLNDPEVVRWIHYALS